MKRKFLANVLAASLVLTMASAIPGVNVNAAQKLSLGNQEKSINLPTGSLKGAVLETELDCTGWWAAHTYGLEIDEKGITVKFKNTTYESATANWNTPLYVIYTNSEAKVDNANPDYKEYMVRRSDDFTFDAFKASTITVTEFPENFDWVAWLNNNKNGASDYQISAVRADDTVLVKYVSNGIVSYSSIPVETDKPAYLSLTGELCKLSGIEQVNYVDFVSDIPESLFVETLTGKGWWDNGCQRGRQYTLTGDGTLDLYVGYTGKEKDTVPDGFFDIELVDDDGKIITTESKGDAWHFGYNDVVTGPVITGAEPNSKTIEEGHQYKVSVTRNGNDVTITYYDITSSETLIELEAKETKFTDTIKVQTIAQIGTFQVCKDKLVMSEFKIGNCYTSSKWWSNTGRTHDQTLTGNGEVSWYVGYYENVSNVTGAFSVELLAEEDSLRYFITTGSDVNAWYASEPEGTTHTTGDNITGVALNSKNIELGHKYKITVQREEQKFTITYFDLDTNSVYAKFVAANTTFPKTDVKVHVMAQVGKYKIEEEPFDVMPEVKNNNKPLASYPVGGSTAGNTASGTTNTTAPTIPPANDENSEGVEMDFAGFWSAHMPGVEVTESGTALTYRNETHSSATGNYQAPIIVAFSSDDGKVYSAGTPGYDEYAVIRADSYAWVGAANTGDGLAAWNNLGYTFQTNATADTWASWVSEIKSGMDGKVQAIKANGKIYIEFTNGNVTTLTSFPAPDGKKVYISLTGEECKISNIKTAGYTGINGITAEPSATATPDASTVPSTEPGTTPEPGNTSEPSNSADPGTSNTPAEPGSTATPAGSSEPTNEPAEPEPTEKPEKKTMKVSGVKAKTGTKKVTGTVSVKKATVQVKIGSKSYKKATVNGKKFTYKVSSKLKKGTKITIKVTKTGYKTVTKTTKVK